MAGSAGRAETSGATLLEFAVTLLCISFLIFGTVELVSAVYTYAVLADAANEGVRYAIVNSTDQAGAVSKVQEYAVLSLHDMSALAVSVTYPDGTAVPPARVAVSVSYQYVPYLTGFMSNPPTIHAYAVGRLVH